jgi:hypothetical protein
MSEIPSVTAGWMTPDQLAADIKRCRRTVARWVARGMPVVKIGASLYIDPAEAREWFRAGMPTQRVSTDSPRAPK